MTDLSALSAWIAATPLSLTIQTTSWVIPTVQSVHILAISVVVASSAMLNLRLAGLIGREQSVQLMAQRFMPPVWWALPVLALTGLTLIIGEPKRELLNPYFWSKMIILLTVIIITVPLQHQLEDRPFRQLPQGKQRLVRTGALVCLLLWLGIIICGRWIAYA